MSDDDYDPIEQDFNRELSRKWRLARKALATVTWTVVGLLVVGIGLFLAKRLEAAEWISFTTSVMGTLTWGIGTVLALYNGANVLAKKVGGGA